ncbi:sugar phosphate isomerase/epimerase [Paraflavitalea speifideaquila]|uniref:sugar phosphate isomerase/epimerase family protein n=1 Tax=Paraflavitalea speifideaquila TaxID=3076558 RepID=UPI0028E8D728|nr:sugar phosphate isomerase/epimerase [Paraflavitalea speifideiaquila]
MTNRRTFIRQTGVLASAFMMGSSFVVKPKYKLGLQLFTIREALSKDVRGTLKKIASFGYQEVETYGFNRQYYRFTPAEFKMLLQENGLTSPSGHYDLNLYVMPGKTTDDLLKYVDECIEGAHILKQQYIVWPWLDESHRSIEAFKEIVATLNKIGERINKAGLQLAYHNHNFEFIEYNGDTGYAMLLRESDPNYVKLELDLYWSTYMKQDLPALFKKHPDRFPLWHLKDKDKTNPELHTTMGDGDIDFTKLLPHASLAGAQHLYVEQGNNYVPNDLACVEKSAGFTKKLLR